MRPEEVLESIEKEAVQKRLPIIGPKRGEFLDEVVKEHNPGWILEVGTLVGYSAIRIGRHLKEGQRITCVELSAAMAEVAHGNFEKAGIADRVEIIVGDALTVLPTLKGTLDMVFFDAEKEDYLAYLKSIERLLHRGSVVIADNMRSHAEEVASYLDYVRNSGRYRSTYRESKDNYRYRSGLTEDDAVEISVRL
jgi:predicted O-methyltransferase YrrM